MSHGRLRTARAVPQRPRDKVGSSLATEAASGSETLMSALVAACAGFLAVLYRAYFATLRVSGLLADGSAAQPREYPFGRELFALCERDALLLAGISTYTPFTALVTLGRDGDWAAALLRRLGFDAVRGSSLRGGSRAVSELVRALRSTGRPAAIVVDGPLGPAGKAKAGTVVVGMRTHRPIRALGVAARREIVFRRTWSRIFLPLPFTRVVIACDDPLPVPTSAGPGQVAALAEELSRRLAFMRRRALDAVGRSPVEPTATSPVSGSATTNQAKAATAPGATAHDASPAEIARTP